jgi:hypothetical protein
MKKFKDFIHEQVVPEGSTTSDPDFMEKKRRDSVIAERTTQNGTRNQQGSERSKQGAL